MPVASGIPAIPSKVPMRVLSRMAIGIARIERKKFPMVAPLGKPLPGLLKKRRPGPGQ